MRPLYLESEPIDVLTVREHLRSTGTLEEAGGKAAIDELTGGVPGLGGIRRYGQIVREHALMRRLLSTTYEIQASVLNHAAAPGDLVDLAERAMLEVAHDDRQKDFRTIDEILDDELRKMEKLSREGTSLTGTPSGFRDLDEITGGFQPGNLIVIAARPSMEKSRPGHEHRRERCDRLRPPGRAVQPGDVRDRARAALRGLAGAHQGRRAAQGPRARQQVAEDPAGVGEARRGAAVHRRLLRRRDHRDPREGAPAAPAAAARA